MIELLQLIYYFFPAYAANMAPPFFAKLFPKWDYPLDASLELNGRRLFGSNKTIRGIIGGTLIAGMVFLAQRILYPLPLHHSLPPWYGLIMGFGALFLGDALKSFWKRRLNIKPGRPWIPFDQLDYTIGTLIVTFGFFWPGWTNAFLLAIINGLFSTTAHYFGARIKLMKDKI